MEQLTAWPKDASGAASSDLCDCHSLAVEAWGEAALAENSGLTAFAYLWRRFGPPWLGCDEYKKLVGYVLTTADPGVFLSLNLSGSNLALSTGYFVGRKVEQEFHKPQSQWEEKFSDWFVSQNPDVAAALKARKVTEDMRYRLGEWRMNKDKVAEAKKVIGNRRLPPLAEGWRKGPVVMRRVNRALLVAMKELLKPVGVRDLSFNILGRLDDGETVAASPFAGYGVPHKAMERIRQKDLARRAS